MKCSKDDDKLVRLYYEAVFAAVGIPLLFILTCLALSQVTVAEEKDSLVHAVMYIILIAAAVIVFVQDFNIYKDWSFVQKKQFEEGICIVIDDDSSAEYPETRRVRLKDAMSAKLLDFRTLEGFAQMNNKYRVIYLPRSGIGAIIEKIEDESAK